MPLLRIIADALGVSFPAGTDGDRNITGASALKTATAADAAALSADKYAKEYATTHAGLVLVGKKIHFSLRPDVPTLLVDDPDLAMVTVLDLLSTPTQHPPEGVHASAVVSPSAVLESGVGVGPNVTIGAGTRIGRNTKLHAGVVIADHVEIGTDCVFFPNVVVRERVTIGNRVVIHALSNVGTDGFGYRWNGKQHVKIPHIGTVVIEDDVEIGSCSCVDRAKYAETRIGRGTKIDNLVQIAHNVTIGQHAILCGQSGMAGTAKLGNGAVLGGGSAVRDHIAVGDGAMAAGFTAIFEDVPPKTTVSGVPSMPHRQTLREQGALRRLPELLTAVRKLQEEVETLRDQLEAQQKQA